VLEVLYLNSRRQDGITIDDTRLGRPLNRCEKRKIGLEESGIREKEVAKRGERSYGEM
jgi:hypothetical protein